LTSMDPTVVVAPSRVRATFRWEQPRVLRIVSPCPTPDACDLGTLRPWRAGAGEAGLTLRLDADTLLQLLGGNFVAEIFPDPSLAQIGGIVAVNGLSGQTNLVDAQLDSVTVTISVPRQGAMEGEYGALVRFSGSSAEVTGLDSLRVQVQIPRPPRTAGEWLRLVLWTLLILAGIVAGTRWALTGAVMPPKMRGQLDVLEPAEWQGTSIRLSGKRVLQVGAGASALGSLPASLEFVAMRTKDRGPFVRLRVRSGDVKIIPAGDRFGMPVASFHDLKTDDRIAVDGYLISFQSF
jgi:hypothetical protein